VAVLVLEIFMDISGIENVLAQLRSASAVASGAKKPSAAEDEVAGADFSQTLKSAVDQVNDAQQTAGKLAREFVSGESDKNLHEVMISLQKANISMQSTIQVRNKVVSAYQTIMNMQV
jgi:flagellar hook-basal body complex protein FliE